MPGGLAVLAIVALIWAAILLPPALGFRARRCAEFEKSLIGGDAAAPSGQGKGTRARCRRQILAGHLVGMAATLVLGLLPPLHLLLSVHLLLLDSFLAYLTLLVHLARLRDRASTAVDVAVAADAADAGDTADDFWDLAPLMAVS